MSHSTRYPTLEELKEEEKELYAKFMKECKRTDIPQKENQTLRNMSARLKVLDAKIKQLEKRRERDAKRKGASV